MTVSTVGLFVLGLVPIRRPDSTEKLPSASTDELSRQSPVDLFDRYRCHRTQTRREAHGGRTACATSTQIPEFRDDRFAGYPWPKGIIPVIRHHCH